MFHSGAIVFSSANNVNGFRKSFDIIVAPARSWGKEDYLLTTKLFCGYCREMMIGYGGTSKSGKVYHYYACKNAKKHLCQKKVVEKNQIEDKVVAACRKLLTSFVFIQDTLHTRKHFIVNDARHTTGSLFALVDVSADVALVPQKPVTST